MADRVLFASSCRPLRVSFVCRWWWRSVVGGHQHQQCFLCTGAAVHSWQIVLMNEECLCWCTECDDVSASPVALPPWAPKTTNWLPAAGNLFPSFPLSLFLHLFLPTVFLHRLHCLPHHHHHHFAVFSHCNLFSSAVCEVFFCAVNQAANSLAKVGKS